jgi:hypothetical protein
MSSVSNARVTSSMVEIFHISPTCYETLPCQHDCNIVLSDGRKKNVCLRAPSIHILTETIALEKIGGRCHLFSKEPTEKKNQTVELQKAENILTRIFSPIPKKKKEEKTCAIL